MKKYQIIYVDPPWEYKNKRRFLNKQMQKNVTEPINQGVCRYPSMKLDEIKSLKVSSICDKNCALFLWTTTPYLEKAFEVIKSWGFTYKTIGFIWLKTWKGKIKNPLEFYMNSVYGMNYYTKLQFEICLLGIKGSMNPISHSVAGQIIADRTKHSEKPKEARSRIVELFGDLLRIELFARQKTLGWDVWGNEVKSDIELLK